MTIKGQLRTSVLHRLGISTKRFYRVAMWHIRGRLRGCRVTYYYYYYLLFISLDYTCRVQPCCIVYTYPGTQNMWDGRSTETRWWCLRVYNHSFPNLYSLQVYVITRRVQITSGDERLFRIVILVFYFLYLKHKTFPLPCITIL